MFILNNEKKKFRLKSFIEMLCKEKIEKDSHQLLYYYFSEIFYPVTSETIWFKTFKGRHRAPPKLSCLK